MQLTLFQHAKGATKKSACFINWVCVDGRIVFEAGKKYTHAKTSELAIHGENGITMFMNKNRYNQHFK